MSRSRFGRAAILVAALAATPATSAGAQGTTAVILPLEATVLDLTATVDDMSGGVSAISAEAQATLGRSDDIAVRTVGDDVILSVTSDVLFGFDSAELSSEAKASLSDIASLILRAPEGKVMVVGHTDSKGSDAYNLELSQRRADAVAGFLEEADVPADRLTTEGRGEAEPLAANEVSGQDNPEGRAQNRRVEFVMPKTMLQN